MYIPKNPVERIQFVLEWINRCMSSQGDRKATCDLYEKYYNFGAEFGVADYNKIEAHVEKVSSYIYEPGALKWSVQVPPDGGPSAAAEQMLVDRATDEFNDLWHAEEHDAALQDAATWGLVYGAHVCKTVWVPKISGPGPVVYTFEPYMLGVGNEAVSDIHSQEVLCHEFMMSADEVWRALRVRHNGRELFDRVSFEPISNAVEPAAGFGQLFLSQTNPTMSGDATPDFRLPGQMYKPQRVQNMTRAFELWVWDDLEDDFQVFTKLQPDVVLFDRKNFVYPRSKSTYGSHPFDLVRPNPVPKYIWGRSEVFGLIGLQKWHQRRLMQVQRLEDLQADPPTAFSGFQGLDDEAMAAFGDPGSNVNTDMPTGKVERLAPDMPKDIFTEIQGIDAFFADKSGVPQMFEGKGEPGVRNNEQAAVLASLGASRIKKKAMNLGTGGLSYVGAKVFRLERRYNAIRMRTRSGMSFVFDQLPDDAVVRVDNNSFSPVFAGGHWEEAQVLVKAGAADGEVLIDASHLPNKRGLKQAYKERQASRAQQIEKLLQADPKQAMVQAKQMMKAPS